MGRRDWGGGYAAKVKVMRAECYRLLLHRWKHFHRLYSLSLSLFRLFIHARLPLRSLFLVSLVFFDSGWILLAFEIESKRCYREYCCAQ